MKFGREKAHQFIQEALDLFSTHWGEVGHYRDIPLEIDFEMYNKMEDAGVLRIYSARDDENQIIGYSFYLIKNNAHYKSSLQASQDIIFIHPEKRGFGKEFINWCDDELRKEGVQVVYHHVKAKKELNFGPMLQRLGYELIDEIYGKRLDKGI